MLSGANGSAQSGEGGAARGPLYGSGIGVMTDNVTFRAVSAENWADFELLFQNRGAPKACWCTAWRKIRPEFKDAPLAKKHEMEARIRGGEPVGILGYADADPVAWCSVSPRSTYRSSMADAREGDEHETIWSIVCFFVMGHFRGKGLFTRLIEEFMRRKVAQRCLRPIPSTATPQAIASADSCPPLRNLVIRALAAKARAGISSENQSSRRHPTASSAFRTRAPCL